MYTKVYTNKSVNCKVEFTKNKKVRIYLCMPKKSSTFAYVFNKGDKIMKCVRCGKEFNNDIVAINAEIYGSITISTCPHCGKAYFSRRIIRINFEPIDDITLGGTKNDDWGDTIVTDKEYNSKKNN